MVRNDPRNPFQRGILVERRSSHAIKARLVSVIHGWMSPNQHQRATLIVMEFSFEPLKVNRRIRSARISVHFEGLPGDVDPEVAAIVPEGRFALVCRYPL
jgi:hypothetical protein